MKKETYQKIYDRFYATNLAKCLKYINSLITLCTYISYPVYLMHVYRYHFHHFIPGILIPGISFLALSIFRHIVNRPRPYEKWKIPPLIPRDKQGHSFPSRHIFSIFIIAVLWYIYYPVAGIFLLLAGFILAFIRVFTGIHYLSDVLAGALIGILCGSLILI